MLVVLCGMPRSGSTLQFNVTWELLERTNSGKKVDWSIGKNILTKYDSLLQFCNSDEVHVIKTHNINENLIRLVNEKKEIRFIYIHRDLRDVVFSMKRKFEYSFSKCIERVQDSISVESKLMELNAVLLVQKYSDIRYQLTQSINQISEFLELQPGNILVEQLASDLNIETAYVKSRTRKVPFEHIRRKLAILFKRQVIFSDEKHMYHPEHVSEKMGHEGSWKNELDIREVDELLSKFGIWMRDKNYI